ncbi:flagellar protein FlhE [Vreelandella venusta]|uniref:flagellar protein FlhE n=1 Tax=Vreelandella venusta TaxID=44935 RepID=UPI001F11AC55|nr:flagellar protein FlhE [Halomonas venusta]WAM48741.1 flagellar protein FlhE [Halomonas venusta]WAM52230.1 flagellar protein FlhE [Halomonas venusta]WAM55761.1 flagellar protein FlhE [Halomonas venusta]
MSMLADFKVATCKADRLLKSVLMVALSVIAMRVYAATGSWSSEVPSVLVAMSERAVSSQPIQPPAGAPVENAAIERIHWRFQMPVNAPVNAWLCHPEQCVSLTAMRGSTTALAGKSVNGPLYLRFALTPGQRPVRVQGLQVIVNYQ